MALLAWYPLNGDIKNYGCGDAELTTVTEGTFVNNGKLGKSLNRGAFQWTASQTGKILNNEAFTYCCWIYVLGTTGSTSQRAMIFGNDTMTPPNNRRFSLFQYPSCNDLHWSWQNSNSNSTYAGGQLTGVLPSNTWTHICVTYENPKGFIYINGELVHSFTGVCNSESFEYATRVVWDSAYHYLNDVRIYNECLSDKQVKEISKGLVAHYKLAMPGGKNLAYNTNSDSTSTNAFTMSLQTGGRTISIEKDEVGTNCVKIVRDNVEHSGWSYMSYNTFQRSVIKANTTYTVSLDIKSTASGTVGFTGLLNGNATGYMTKSTQTIKNVVTANQWNHLIFRCTTIDDLSTVSISNQVIYFSMSAGLRATGVTLWIKNVKLEEGEQDTPWIPHETDALYTQLGYNNILNKDVSGYGYHGTIGGTIENEKNSPRYITNAKYTTGTDYIKTPINLTMSELSISFWVKPNASNGGYSIITSAYNDPGGALWLATNCESKKVWAYRGAYIDVAGSLTNDVWYHCVYTFNKGVSNWYINGEKQTLSRNTYTGTTMLIKDLCIGNSYTGTSWNTKRYGGISDFRLYCTELSESDILTLYKTSGIIDNNKNMYSYEFIEEDY